MHALISADMEGATGVTYPEDCMLGTHQFDRFRPIFTGDVNAVALGFLDAGVDEVVVCEAHGSMRNLVLEQLDPRIRMITGRHKTYSMMEGVQAKPDVVAFVGYHAPAGGEGILSHTMIGSLLVRVELNGVVMSEGYLNALLCAEYGTRVALVSGDDKTCDDAYGYAPDARRVAVKEAVDRYTANCLHPAVTSALLRKAAAESLDATSFVATEPPYVCEAEFAVTSAAAACSLIPGVERTDDRRIRMTFNTIDKLYQCFTVVCQVATSSSEKIYG